MATTETRIGLLLGRPIVDAEGRALLMRFSCQDGEARMQDMNLDP